PGEPFACAGTPLPTTAPELIQVRGTVTDPFQGDRPISGATEIGYEFSKPITDPTTVESDTFHTTTDSMGAFSASQRTGGHPHTSYLLSQHANYLDIYAFPALQVASDFGVTLHQFGGLQFGGLICTGCPKIGASICQSCPVLDPS